MRSYGFSDVPDESTVHDIIRTKRGDLPDLVHAHPSDTVRDAIQIMNTYGVSQLPVLTAEPPVVMGEVAGRARRDVPGRRGVQRPRPDDRRRGRIPRRAARSDRDRTSRSRAARAALAAANALLVTEDGKPVAVLTRQDLLNFLSD